MIISIIVVCIVVGLLLWAVSAIPMDPVVARIVRVLVIVALVLWILSHLGPAGK